jgi:hypothetical protein
MIPETMKRVIIATLTIFCLLTVAAQDIIVKKDGDTLRVYDLKINAKFITYREYPGKDFPSKRIGKAKVLSVKKSRGNSVEISKPDPAPVKVQQPVKVQEKDTVVYFTEAVQGAAALTTNEKPSKEQKGEVLRPLAADNTQLVVAYNKIYDGYDSKVPKKSKASRAVAIMGMKVSSALSNEDVTVEISKCEESYMRYKIFVRNKSNKTIYIDLENCFRLYNDETFKFYYTGKQIKQNRKSNQKVVLTDRQPSFQTGYDGKRRGKSHTTTYNFENKKETSQVVKEQRFIAIPPMGKVALPPEVTFNEYDDIIKSYEKFAATISSERFGVCKWQITTFDEQESPYCNTFQITYSHDKSFDVYSTVMLTLYMKQLIGLGTGFSKFDETRLKGYDKNVICGEVYFE